MNVSKMDKVRDRQGNEYAFAKVKRNDWGEYVVQVYVNGTYSEDSTYYTDDKEDAEMTRCQMMAQVSGSSFQGGVKWKNFVCVIQTVISTNLTH